MAMGKSYKCKLEKSYIIGSQVSVIGTDGIYYSGVIVDLKTEFSEKKPQKTRYLIKFDSKNNDHISSSLFYSDDQIIGPGFTSIKNVKLNRGQIVYCTHYGREITAKVHFHNYNKNNVELVINNKNKEIVISKTIEEVSLIKSEKSEHLADSNANLINYKKRNISCTDLNTKASKSPKKLKENVIVIDDDDAELSMLNLSKVSKPLINKKSISSELGDFIESNQLLESMETSDVLLSNTCSVNANKKNVSKNITLPIKVNTNFKDTSKNRPSFDKNLSTLLNKKKQNKLSNINLENFSIIHSPIEGDESSGRVTVLTTIDEKKKISNKKENKSINQTVENREKIIIESNESSTNFKNRNEILKNLNSAIINEKNERPDSNKKNCKEAYSVTLKRITPKVIFQCGLKGLDGEICGQIKIEHKDLEEHIRKDHVESVIEHIQKAALKKASTSKEPDIVQFLEIPKTRTQDNCYNNIKNSASENFNEFKQSNEQSDFVITNAFSLSSENSNDALASKLPISINQVYLEEISKILGSDVISLNLDIEDEDKKTVQKCRRVYGKLLKKNWCSHCKWKKACTRFVNQNEEENAEDQEKLIQNKCTGSEINLEKTKDITLNNKDGENLFINLPIDETPKETSYVKKILQVNNLEKVELGKNILSTQKNFLHENLLVLPPNLQIISQSNIQFATLLHDPSSIVFIN